MLGASPAGAQGLDAAPTDISIGKSYVLHSAVLGEDRRVFVHLPADYGRSGQRYPVLYLLDAESQFVHTAGVVDFLAANERAPGMIVVAIPNTHRNRDLTPATSDAAENTGHGQSPGQVAGGADDFVKFLTDELAPWVDSRLRTEKFRILVGHSLGGLFSWHTLVNHPDAFQAHITVSPSLWWDAGRLVPPADPAVASRLRQMSGRHFMYLSWADDEPKIAPKTQELVKWLQANPPAALQWTHRHYPGETHQTNPHRSVYDGLEWLFAGWRMPGQEGYWRAPPAAEKNFDLATVQAHYAALSKKYGFTVPPSSDAIQRVTYHLLGRGQYDAAITLLQQNERNYPYRFGSSAALADALEQAGRWTQAAEAYERAAKLALDDSTPNIDQADRYRLSAQRNRDRQSAARP